MLLPHLPVPSFRHPGVLPTCRFDEDFNIVLNHIMADRSDVVAGMKVAEALLR